ncbi:MAG: TonB-dependent receptor [Bacteroidales bacterium]
MVLLVLSQIAFSASSQVNPTAGITGAGSLEQTGLNTVYLHLDKSTYFAGDIIWYKSYVVDPFTLVPANQNVNVFVELNHQSGQTVLTGTHRAEGGVVSGHFTLPDSLPDGNYVLRAFTSDVFIHPNLQFRRELYIQNPGEAQYISRSSLRQNHRFNRDLQREQSTLTGSVKAEGGSLVAGVPGVVVFRLYAPLFKGQQDVSWRLTDQQRQILAEGTTGPMGYGRASWTPVAGANYFIEFLPAQGARVQIRVPSVKPSGAVMALDVSDENLLMFNIHQSPSLISEAIFVIHGGGKVFYQQELINETSTTIAVPRNDLAAGVNVATLFHPSGEILAERLFFVPQPAMPDFAVELHERQKDEKTLLAIDLVGQQIVENTVFSVSVTEFSQQELLRPYNIFSDLWLSSRLGVSIASPGSLFEDSSLLPVLDMVLSKTRLTRIEASPRAKNSRQQYVESLLVRGEVEVLSSRLVTGVLPVELSLNVDGDQSLFNTSTDADGSFVFQGLNFMGFGQAQITFGQDFLNRRMRVNLFSGFPNVSDNMQNSRTRRLQVLERGDNWRRVPAYFHPYQRVQQRMVQPQSSPFGSPNHIIYVSDMVANYQTTYEILATQVPGLSFEGIGVVLRGAGSIASSNHAMLMIDGVETNLNAFLNIPPTELARIEVFKSNNAAIFGFRGVNGVIIAYTRRAVNDVRQNTFDFIVGGYSLPRSFDLTLIDPPNRSQDGYVQTFAWEPEPKWENGRTSIEIDAERISGDLLLHLEGIDPNGNLLQQKVVIRLGS